jgi:predicted short-subunit dehydrogenase-like oxidoreductase (DUF2520 family)
MKVIIIGTGRVGTVIGYLLREKGFRIMGVYNRHYESSCRALEKIGEGNPYTKKELLENIPLVDLLVITTPDGVIRDTVKLVGRGNPGKDTYIMHMSGLLSSDVLKIEDWHGGIFSFHPLQAVASFEEGIKLLPEAVFTIEGNESGERFAKELAETLNLKYFIIEKKYKPLYHAAAVIASNYLVTLLNSSFKLLKEAGLDRNEFREGLINLVRGTLQNIERLGTAEALTGPVVRGDVDTIKSHQQALKELIPSFLELYQVLGKYTAEMVEDEKLKEHFK